MYISIQNYVQKLWVERKLTSLVLSKGIGIREPTLEETIVFSNNDNIKPANPVALNALAMGLDIETYTHSRRVSTLAHHLAEFDNLQPSSIEKIKLDGLLHDIGKRFLPLDVLMKPGKLTKEDKNKVRRHPVLGHFALRKYGLKGPAETALVHHYFDGYPKSREIFEISGKKPDYILPRSRYTTIADSVDTMLEGRSWQKPMDPHDVKAILYDKLPRSYWPLVDEAIKFSLKMKDTEIQKQEKQSPLLHLPRPIEVYDRPALYRLAA